MNERVKIALIAGAALVLGVYIYSYNTPYQSCVRAISSGDYSKAYAQVWCAKNSN